MKRINIILGIIAIVISMQTQAQQEPHFTQYLDNTLFSNPAYAGGKGALSAAVLHREQWTRIQGYPRTSTFHIHSPLKYNTVGVGLSFLNDQAGPIRQSMIMADVSYAIQFKNKTKLTMGVKAGANIIGLDREKLYNAGKPIDATINGVDNRTNPNIGFGLMYFGKDFFIGVSSPKLIENSYKGAGFNLEKQHYYFVAAYVLSVGNKWKLRPSLQGKGVHGAFGADASLTAIYQDQFLFGMLYRLDAAIGAFVQIHITPQLKIGIGSDFGLKEIRKHNAGTVEAMIAYDFSFGNNTGVNDRKGVYSPRYF